MLMFLSLYFSLPSPLSKINKSDLLKKFQQASPEGQMTCEALWAWILKLSAMEETLISSPNPYIKILTPQHGGTLRWGLWEVTKVDEGMRVGPS